MQLEILAHVVEQRLVSFVIMRRPVCLMAVLPSGTFGFVLLRNLGIHPAIIVEVEIAVPIGFHSSGATIMTQSRHGFVSSLIRPPMWDCAMKPQKRRKPVALYDDSHLTQSLAIDWKTSTAYSRTKSDRSRFRS